MRAMILLDDVVKILALPQFASVWHHPLRFQFLECFWIGRIFINRNDARNAGMSRSKGFREEAFGCLSISGGTEQKFQGVSMRIGSSIELHPDLFHFDIGLINTPRVVRRVEMRSATFLQFWRVVLYPTVDRGVIDVQATLPHHFLEVSITEPHSADTISRT